MKTQADTIVEPQTVVQVDRKDRRKRIGLYGGTFNPIHTSHLIVGDQVGNALGLDKVMFLPDVVPPHVDTKYAIDPQLRVEMIRLAIQGNPLFDIELAEIERGGVSYTYDTVVALMKKHPDVDYYFIIGGDMVQYLPKWHRIDELSKLVTFVGVQRRGFETESKYPVVWVDVPMIDISSTDIRQRIKEGQSVRYFVPDSVIHFIKEHHLYFE